MLQNNQIIDIIPLPGLLGKQQAGLISHFVWIGGYIRICGSIAFFNEGDELIPENRIIGDSLFTEYKFQDIVAMKDRFVNSEGHVVPEFIESEEGQMPNPDVYKNEYDFFRQTPLGLAIDTVEGKTIEEVMLTMIRYNFLDLFNEGKIKRA